MTRQVASMKKTRNRYSSDFKTEALALADRVGATTAARELNLQTSQLYQWRAKAQQKANTSERDKRWPMRMRDSSGSSRRKQRSLKSQKSRGVFCQEPEVKYAFIHQHRQAFSVQRLCQSVGVARSGYYAWRQRDDVPSVRRHLQAALDHRVASAFHRKQGRSGAPRLTLDLKDNGLSINRKTVAASLRRQGLRARAARRFKATTNSRRSLPVAPNLLQQDFVAVAPNQKWVGDITHLWTDEGWLYTVGSHRLVLSTGGGLVDEVSHDH